jgi:aspartyl-tRNA(Asn)/glutamyl-tRNA(Gln) amidotransferase subunit A
LSAWNGETIDELRAALAQRATTSVALTERCLERIVALNPRLNAFIMVTADAALEAARAADAARARGDATGPLHGIPISIKDLIDQAGLPNTAGSRVRRDAIAASDATVTARLARAGVVVVGRTNLHEFAFGTTTEDSGFGLARHPIDDTRSPGGSSGGSGIAVRTGMSIASIGTDTGGSIRIPAAACGVVGLKPGWGEIPTDGVVPLSRQLDHVGPLARTVTDAWLMHEVLAGRSPAPDARLAATPLAGARIGLLDGYFWERMDRDVETAARAAVEALQKAGAIVEPVTIPHAADMAAIYLPLVFGDAAAYHADTLERRPDDYTPNVRLRLEMGRYVLAEDYVRAMRGRELIAREIDQALEGRAALLCPTLPIPAPPIGAVTVPVRGGDEPVRNAMLRLTQPFNLGRQPAISLPCGVTPQGLPVGLQLIGALGHTRLLLQFAAAVEQVLPPH